MNDLHRLVADFLTLLLPALSPACGTLPNGRLWGEDATVFPGWERLGNAALTAVTDPFTWAPLVGAAVLQIDDWDAHVSDWASENTPVFGSQSAASDARSLSGNISDAVWAVTTLATPGGTEAGQWTLSKLKGIAVDASARLATNLTTGLLKDVSGRTRPNGNDDQSFPSKHASRIGVNYTLASRNLRSIPMSGTARTALNVGLVGATSLGAWSRVEAGDHYLSDVLVGVALGHFFGAFMNDAFLGLGDSDCRWDLVPLERGAMLECSIRF